MTRDRSGHLLARGSLKERRMSQEPAPVFAGARASVAARVARAFPAPALVAGWPLFHRDRIVLRAASARAVDAVVRSGRTRRVRLEACGEDALGVACSCTPRAVGVAACKHLWAALLAIDRVGALDALRGPSTPLALVPLGGELADDDGAPQAPSVEKAKVDDVDVPPQAGAARRSRIDDEETKTKGRSKAKTRTKGPKARPRVRGP
jgi:hypothetical protein